MREKALEWRGRLGRGNYQVSTPQPFSPLVSVAALATSLPEKRASVGGTSFVIELKSKVDRVTGNPPGSTAPQGQDEESCPNSPGFQQPLNNYSAPRHRSDIVVQAGGRLRRALQPSFPKLAAPERGPGGSRPIDDMVDIQFGPAELE